MLRRKKKRSTLSIECKGLLLKRNGMWCISYDHMLQLEQVNGTLSPQKYLDEILEYDVRPSLNSLECQSMVLQDDNEKPQRARIIEEYKNLKKIASFPLPSLSPDLNPIEHF